MTGISHIELRGVTRLFGAQVAAGSVVLKAVPPHTIVAGVPAKEIGKPSCAQPALEMNHHVDVPPSTPQFIE